MTDLIPTAAPRVAGVDMGGGHTLELGQWYWITTKASWNDEEPDGTIIEKLVCAMQIGSNYVEVHTPKTSRGHSTWRVHFDEFWELLRYEPNPEPIFAERVAHWQGRSMALMAEVQATMARLGVAPTTMIAQASGDSGGQLAVLSAQVDTESYKADLALAKKETLPKLFEAIKGANEQMAKWMSAPVMSTMAQVMDQKDAISHIEDRIATIGLYAGLTEVAVPCCEGDPAPMGELLRVMQRRLYMDEECLLDYEAGGMQFKDIRAFDAWIAEPKHRDRLLPFPRTLAAFRVRRFEKDRDHGGNPLQAFIDFQEAQADKFTFIYIRNGDQVWRIVCDFEVDEKLFPDEGGFGPEPMMVKMFGHRVERLMPRREYDVLMAKRAERLAKLEAWKLENPDKSENGWFHAPSELTSDHRDIDPREWRPFDQSNVYYDEALQERMAAEQRRNRLAVIIQGLFDRSPVLHPHPPVQTWTQAGFERAMELVYDASGLFNGDPPDFEAYRREVNASLGVGSVTVGQHRAWLSHGAAKENARRKADWRRRSEYQHELTSWHAYGDDGPGRFAVVAEWAPRARKATFRWKREAQGRGRWGDMIPASIAVGADRLFNVSAYKPGDFKRFLGDHRTRAAYLKWAPFLLAAEDYHAGKGVAQEPS